MFYSVDKWKPNQNRRYGHGKSLLIQIKILIFFSFQFSLLSALLSTRSTHYIITLSKGRLLYFGLFYMDYMDRLNDQSRRFSALHKHYFY